MPKKSQRSEVLVRKKAKTSRASAKDLERLHAAMSTEVDTSDIPEQRERFKRLKRDSAGMLPRRSIIRDAVVLGMEQLNFTPYRLWKTAKEYCPTLSESAVYEFVKGTRQIELPYAEALISAVRLKLVAGGVTKQPATAKQTRK